MILIIHLFCWLKFLIGTNGQQATNCNVLSFKWAKNGIISEIDENGAWKKRKWTDQSGKLFIKALIRPISIEEDSQIFHGCVLEFPSQKNENFGGPQKNGVAIKEVFFRGNNYYKTNGMLAHEVEMLKLATKMGAKFTAKLMDYIILPNSLVMVMELGEESLKHRLKRLKIEWEKHRDLATINSDIKSILIQMVIALRDLHRFAIHLALKSENWLFINKNGEKVLALIDFQTSAPIRIGDHKIDVSSTEKRNELRLFMCKTIFGRTHLPRTKSFASPEHKVFCENQQQQQEENEAIVDVSVKTDIWSLGISMLELLSYTPQIDGAIFKFEFSADGDEKRKFKILRNAFVGEAKKDLKNEELNAKVKIIIEKNFPQFYALIEQTLKINPKNRPTADELLSKLLE